MLVESRDFFTHLHYQTGTPVGVPVCYCRMVWFRKTRIVWLPEGERSLRIRLFVLTTECDRQQDGQTDR